MREAMEARPELNNQTVVARKAVVSQSTVSRLLRGEVDSQGGTLKRVCAVLGISIGSPDDDPTGHAASVSSRLKDVLPVPLISLVQAGGWGETVDPYLPGDGHRWVVCPVRCGSNTFALKVDGASMEPRYQNGDIIFVDPDVSPTQGSDVVVRLENSHEATFKQLVVEGSRRWLKPLNPQFPSIEITSEARIVGAVIGAVWGKTPLAP